MASENRRDCPESSQIPPPSEAQPRVAYYRGRVESGAYLNKPLSFYPGAPTVPQSFTGNLIAVGNGNGPGAKILNGIGPAQTEEIPCVDPVITSLMTFSFPAMPDTLGITVLYNVEPGDLLFVFNTSTGQVIYPATVSPVAGGFALTFDLTSPPADVGSWTFKVVRAGNPNCFAIRSGVYVVTGTVCSLTADAWTLSGGLPFPELGFLAGTSPVTWITGSGFTGCTLDVTVELFISFNPAPPTLPVIGLTVTNDNLIEFTVDGSGVATNATYQAVISCTDIPGCEVSPVNFLSFRVEAVRFEGVIDGDGGDGGDGEFVVRERADFIE